MRSEGRVSLLVLFFAAAGGYSIAAVTVVFALDVLLRLLLQLLHVLLQPLPYACCVARVSWACLQLAEDPHERIDLLLAAIYVGRSPLAPAAVSVAAALFGSSRCCRCCFICCCCFSGAACLLLQRVTAVAVGQRVCRYLCALLRRKLQFRVLGFRVYRFGFMV